MKRLALGLLFVGIMAGCGVDQLTSPENSVLGTWTMDEVEGNTDYLSDYEDLVEVEFSFKPDMRLAFRAVYMEDGVMREESDEGAYRIEDEYLVLSDEHTEGEMVPYWFDAEGRLALVNERQELIIYFTRVKE